MSTSPRTIPPDELIIEVPEVFVTYIDAVIVRLGYLKPDLQLFAHNGTIRSPLANTADAEKIKREVMHMIYRERIYSETLELRQTLLKVLVS